MYAYIYIYRSIYISIPGKRNKSFANLNDPVRNYSANQNTSPIKHTGFSPVRAIAASSREDSKFV
jgi:hypothetical protein